MNVTKSGSRATFSSVTFEFPFVVGKDTRELAAGTYSISTYEDTYQGGFEPVYVAVEVELVVVNGGERTSRLLRPADLRAALERDAVASQLEKGGAAPLSGIMSPGVPR